MGTRLQTQWQPAAYRFPATSAAPLSTLFALPNPTAGMRAYRDAVIERRYRLRESELPARAEFLLGCALSGLVSDATLAPLAGHGTLVQMEQAIDEAILRFGASVKVRRRAFTKAAKRRLRRIDERPDSLPDLDTLVLVADEAMRADLLEPNQALRLIDEGERGIQSLALDTLQAIDARLPPGYGAALYTNGLSIHCHNTEYLCLNLPTDEAPASHALRIAVIHALFAISECIAAFHDPQTMFDLSNRYLYYLDDVWNCFKPLIVGKGRAEIYNILSECDRTRWEFEPYIFSVDDPQEIIPGSESFDRLVDILAEIEHYQRQFNIAANGYFQAFEATCQFQIELMQGQARTYPEHAGVYAVLAEAFTCAAEFRAAGKRLEDIYESQKEMIVEEQSSPEEGIALFGGLFVMPGDNFGALGDLLDDDINNLYQNVGGPNITIMAEPGVLLDMAIPIVDAIHEAYRLVKRIETALEGITHVGS
jgi:hypothetical protein